MEDAILKLKKGDTAMLYTYDSQVAFAMLILRKLA
jgi:hypothetical protein